VAKKKTVKNDNDTAIKNEAGFMQGLNESFDPTSVSNQLSQADTLFRANRWYLVSNMRQLLSEIYVEIGLVQTLVDVPVNDGLRGGVKFNSKQLDEEDIKKLTVKMDREQDLDVAGEAAKWNRLFGGAGIVIITEQEPELPLNAEALKNGKLEFRAVDMWELFWSKQDTSDYAAVIDAKEILSPAHYDYYGVQLDHTRVMKLTGIKPPSFVRPRLRGWGVSIVEALIRSINQYLKATNLSFEVLDEFKLDIFKIKNLANTLATKQGAESVRQRVQLANYQKNYQNALTMDSEDDYIQKQLSFAGIAEAMSGIRLQIASDMRMPLTKIFGISASGFSSGEDDIENYNAMVESQVRGKLKWNILRMAELRCVQLFGFVPDDLDLEFKPLRVLGAEAEENVKTQKFNRVLQAKQAGLITSEEFRDAVNRDNLVPIQLANDPMLIDELETDQQQDQAEASAEKVPTGSKVTTTAAKEAKEAKV
jgi:phage-related protein (TIGR01555 family)